MSFSLLKMNLLPASDISKRNSFAKCHPGCPIRPFHRLFGFIGTILGRSHNRRIRGIGTEYISRQSPLINQSTINFISWMHSNRSSRIVTGSTSVSNPACISAKRRRKDGLFAKEVCFRFDSEVVSKCRLSLADPGA